MDHHASVWAGFRDPTAYATSRKSRRDDDKDPIATWRCRRLIKVHAPNVTRRAHADRRDQSLFPTPAIPAIPMGPSLAQDVVVELVLTRRVPRLFEPPEARQDTGGVRLADWPKPGAPGQPLV